MRVCVFYILYRLRYRGRVYRPYTGFPFDFVVDSESLCLTFRRTRFVGRPPLSLLRRRFAPLRGTQRRCAALRAAPRAGATRARAQRVRSARAGLWQTRKKCPISGGRRHRFLPLELDTRVRATVGCIEDTLCLSAVWLSLSLPKNIHY